MAVSIVNIYTALVLLFIISTTLCKVPKQRLCADKDCQTRISKARGSLHYVKEAPEFISLKPGDEIEVYGKGCGENTGLWFVKVGNVFGYAPSKFIKETNVEIRDPQECVTVSENTHNSKPLEGSVAPTTTGGVPENSINEQPGKSGNQENSKDAVSQQTSHSIDNSEQNQVVTGNDGPSLPTQNSDEVKNDFNPTATPKLEPHSQTTVPSAAADTSTKEEPSELIDDTVVRGGKIYLNTNGKEIMIGEVTPTPSFSHAPPSSADPGLQLTPSAPPVANSAPPESGMSTTSGQGSEPVPDIQSSMPKFESSASSLPQDPAVNTVQTSNPRPAQDPPVNAGQGTTGSPVREPATNAAQGTNAPPPAKEPSINAAQGTNAPPPAKEPAINAAQGTNAPPPVKEPATDAAQGTNAPPPAKEPAINAAQGTTASPVNTAQDSAPPPAQEPAINAVQNTTAPPVQDSTVNTAQDSAAPHAQEPAINTAQDTTAPPVQDSAVNTAQASSPPPVQDSVPSSIQDSAVNTAQGSAPPPTQDQVESSNSLPESDQMVNVPGTELPNSQIESNIVDTTPSPAVSQASVTSENSVSESDQTGNVAEHTTPTPSHTTPESTTVPPIPGQTANTAEDSNQDPVKGHSDDAQVTRADDVNDFSNIDVSKDALKSQKDGSKVDAAKNDNEDEEDADVEDDDEEDDEDEGSDEPDAEEETTAADKATEKSKDGTISSENQPNGASEESGKDLNDDVINSENTGWFARITNAILGSGNQAKPEKVATDDSAKDNESTDNPVGTDSVNASEPVSVNSNDKDANAGMISEIEGVIGTQTDNSQNQTLTSHTQNQSSEITNQGNGDSPSINTSSSDTNTVIPDNNQENTNPEPKDGVEPNMASNEQTESNKSVHSEDDSLLNKDSVVDHIVDKFSSSATESSDSANTEFSGDSQKNVENASDVDGVNDLKDGNLVNASVGSNETSESPKSDSVVGEHAPEADTNKEGFLDSPADSTGHLGDAVKKSEVPLDDVIVSKDVEKQSSDTKESNKLKDGFKNFMFRKYAPNSDINSQSGDEAKKDVSESGHSKRSVVPPVESDTQNEKPELNSESEPVSTHDESASTTVQPELPNYNVQNSEINMEEASGKAESNIESETIQRSVTNIADENVTPPSEDLQAKDENTPEHDDAQSGMDASSGYIDSLKPSVQNLIDVLPEWMQLSAGSLEHQGISPRVVILTIIMGVLVMILLIAVAAAKTRSAEFSLAVKLCHLDQKLFSITTERNIMRDELEHAKEKINHLEQNLIESRRSVSPLQEELGQAKKTCVELKATVASLEEELGSATEAGLELNQMLSDFLTSQNQNSSLQGSIETLQTQLNSQHESMKNLHLDLEQKIAENKDMKIEAESMSKRNEVLEAENKELAKELEHVQNTNVSLKEKVEVKTEESDILEVENCSFKVQLEDAERRLHQLTDEVSQLKNNIATIEEDVASKNDEILTLKQTMESMNMYKDNSKELSDEERDKTLQELLNITKIKASLKSVSEEKDILSIKYKTEVDLRKEHEAEALRMKGECMNMERNMKSAAQEKQEAETRLEILSKYFKEKEAELQKQLGLQEAIVQQSTESAENAGQKAAAVEQNISLYKSQYDTLKKEMDEMERSYKNQIAIQEKKAHENWLAARNAERKLDDMKTDSGILRNKLTLLEQEKASLLSSTQSDSILKPKPQRTSGQNGDLSGSLYTSHESASESALTAPSPMSQNSTSELSGMESPRARFMPLERPGLPPIPFPPMGMPMFDERGPLPPLGMPPPPMMPMMPPHPYDRRSPPPFERRSHGRISPDRQRRSNSPRQERERISPYSNKDQYSSRERERVSPMSDRDRRAGSSRGRSPPRDRNSPYSDRDRRPRSPTYNRSDRSPGRYDSRDKSPSFRDNREPRYSPRYDRSNNGRRYSPPPPRNRSPPPSDLPMGHPLKPPPMVQREVLDKSASDRRTSPPSSSNV